MAVDHIKKIPKVIHMCWFGKGLKGEVIEKCIKTWREKLPDYEIVEWNESNFDVNDHHYSKHAFEMKRWAFISDYARLKILYEYGGVYLDTDMYILKSFNEFLDSDYGLVLGKEDDIHISAGMIACSPRHPYILDLLNYYDNQKEFVTIPRILTEVYEKNKHSYNQNKIKIFEPVYFYPFSASKIKNFKIKSNSTNAPIESYAVHMWNYSWGHPLVKLSKKLGLHSLAHTVAKSLGVTNLIKKIFRVI
jgi:hypothetical protein